MDALTIITHSAEETAALGTCLGECVHTGDVIVLAGDLGAGKTQLAGGLARALGISEPVTSPTFTVLKLYEGGRIPLYHFDLYRLDKAEQLDDLDFWDVVGAAAPGTPTAPGIVLIEWGDMFDEVTKRADLSITLRISSDPQTRSIELSPHTPRSTRILQQWAPTS